MKEIYLITRLDAINNFFVAFLIISIIFIVVSTFAWFISGCSEDCVNKFRKRCYAICIPLVIFNGIAVALTPTTKEAFMIMGVGSTIDYVRNDSIASQLPHEAIKALDSWVKEIGKEPSSNNKHSRDYD